MIVQFGITLAVGVVTYHFYRFIIFMQLEKQDILYKHYPGVCKQLQGAGGGSEDMTTLADGTTLISSGLYKGREAKILLFDFKDKKQHVKELIIQGNIPKFRPLGLSTWTDPESDTVTVMVSNIAGPGSVEFFEYAKGSSVIKHIKSVSTGGIHLDDIVATGNNSFYGSEDLENYHGNILTYIELLGYLRHGKVWYFDGEDFRPVLRGLMMPNGINISPDKKYLYISDLTDKKVLTYQINEDNSLKLMQELFVDSCCDNIEIDHENGDLWLGCHPRLYALYNYHFNHNGYTTAPSQILKITQANGLPTSDITEVFLDDGTFCSASSVASYFKGKMLIGTIASQLVLCDV